MSIITQNTRLQTFSINFIDWRSLPYVFILFVALLSTTLFNTAYAAEAVGSVTFARGTIAANSNGQDRILGKGADVFEGDNIQTSERSFVIITFIDKTKITIRPNSSFTVTQFSQNTKQGTVKLKLHQGGIRTSSGDLANNKPEDFQITTPDTIINAQQADFSVRVCQQNCQKEEDKLQKGMIKIKREVIARIVKVKGSVYAINSKIMSQESRPLAVGAPLYSTDTLNSAKNSYAILVFKDKGRITLEADSQFAISEYHLNKKDTQDKALYDLVSGGMRVLTGSIGKANNEDYEINTTVATIGIRGTGFDLLERGNGLYSQVWKGTIAQTNGAGTTLLSAPHSNYIKDKEAEPKPLQIKQDSDKQDAEDKQKEKSAFKMNAPRPDKVAVHNESELFDYIRLDVAKPGTYVHVHSGHVQVADSDGTPLDLGKSESSYTNTKGKTVRTERPTEFMLQDPYPLPNENFDEGNAEITSFSLLADNIELQADAEIYQCVCK